MKDKASITEGRGMRLAPALCLSVLLHGGLLFALHAPGLPFREDAKGGVITISLLSPPVPPGGAQNSVPERAAKPAPLEARTGPARAKKNPAIAAPQAETKHRATADPENSARSILAPSASQADMSGRGGALLAKGSFSGPVPGGGSLANPKPAYPELARRRGQEGTVFLLAEVDEKGAAKSVVVQRSSGYALLDEAALKAVRRWRFNPAHLAGGAISSRVLVPVEFRLRNERKS